MATQQQWQIVALSHRRAQTPASQLGLASVMVLIVQELQCFTEYLLVLQVWNAIERYNVNLSSYPKIESVYKRCLQLPAIDAAMPEKQSDYTPPAD